VIKSLSKTVSTLLLGFPYTVRLLTGPVPSVMKVCILAILAYNVNLILPKPRRNVA
jgi:hypothetical protein